ncbi:MAG: hypothetical protein V4609_11465 [Pseudomonadota bacterium]
MPPASRPRSRPLSFAAAAALIFALLLAQALGLAHRAAHGQGLGLAVLEGARAIAAPQDPAAPFAGHAPGSDCRLFDALTHEQGAPPAMPAQAPPPAGPILVAATAPGEHIVASATPFDARGPPART